MWGYRRVHCAEVKLRAQTTNIHDAIQESSTPSDLDWLLPEAVESYSEVGDPRNSAQVNPYIFTSTLAKLAKEKGATIVYGSITGLNYKEGRTGISSVTYIDRDSKNSHELAATDVVVAAGPWTSKLFPAVQLGAPRGHSVVVRPSQTLSPHVLFTEVEPPKNGTLSDIISPEIYPRPADDLHAFDTVYVCGPDDYEVPLPDNTGHVEVDPPKTEDVWTAVKR